MDRDRNRQNQCHSVQDSQARIRIGVENRYFSKASASLTVDSNSGSLRFPDHHLVNQSIESP